MTHTARRSSGRLTLPYILCLGITLLSILPANTSADSRAQSRAEKGHILEVIAPEQNALVSGTIHVETKVSELKDNADYDVRYQIDGPSGFIYTARQGPYKLFGEEGWDTSTAQAGDYTLHAFFIHNHRCIDFRIIRFSIVKDLTIESVQGVNDGDVLTDPVQVQANIDGGTPSRVVFHLDGPQTLTSIERYDPYVMLGDGAVWDVTRFPAGQYTLSVTAYSGSFAADSITRTFQIAPSDDDGPFPMDPIDTFTEETPTDETPSTPRTGDDNPLPTAKSRNFLGMNLAEVTYYTREWVFVDAMKQSRQWLPTYSGGSAPWDSGESLALNSEGWPILKPGQAAHTITMIDTDGAYPAGYYTCTYEGDGELAFGRDARVIKREGKRITLDVTPTDSGIYLRVDSSNPTNPVRNIKLWLPGFENSESSFHPLYIERLKPFSVIRFMDWARVNGSNAVTASDLPDEDYYTQGTDEGVALKYMIELCNELGADPWFCMPHKADDGYVFSFATQVKEQLRPDLNVYIEWSNEVWNSQFPQHNWVKAKADGVSLSEGFRRVWAQESIRDFEIWRDVFGSQSDRVIRVAAGQKDNPWVTEKLAEALNGQFDALSCSTYFALTSSQRGLLSSSTTASRILDLADQEMSRGVRSNYQAHGKLARDWSNKLGRNIPLIAYEGGQHYTAHGGNPPWASALIDVQSHPRIYQIYLDNMREWENAGGSLFVAFNFVDKPDKWGSWGALDYQDQDLDEAHKYRALLDYKSSTDD